MARSGWVSLWVVLAFFFAAGAARAQIDAGTVTADAGPPPADAGPPAEQVASAMAGLAAACEQPRAPGARPDLTAYCSDGGPLSLGLVHYAQSLGDGSPQREARAERRTEPQALPQLPDITATGSVVDIVLRGLSQFLWSRMQVEFQRTVTSTLRGLIRREHCTATPTTWTERIESDPCRVLPATCGLLSISDTPEPACDAGTAGDAGDAGDAGTSRAPPSDLAALGDALRNALARDVVNLPRSLEALFDDRTPMALRLSVALSVALADGSGPGQIAARLRRVLGSPGSSEPWRQLENALMYVELITLAQSNHRDGRSQEFTNREFRALIAALPADASIGEVTASAMLLWRELDRSVAAVQRAAHVIASEEVNEADRLAQVVPLVREFSTALRTALLLQAPPSRDAGADPVDQFLRSISTYPDIFDALARRDIPRFLANALAAIERASTEAGQRLPSRLIQVITFGAELASANDVDAAVRVFESIALPPGAWSRQAQQETTMIGAVVGVGGGYNVNLADGPSDGGFVELVAMLGIDHTWPLNDRAHRWFYGFFFPLIDVGTLLSAEATETGRARPVERPLRVISPGVTFHFNYQSMSVGLGVTLVPFAHREDWSPALRVMGTFGFAFPLFAL